MSDKKVRFAMVGAGGIAQAYAQAFESSEHARLVAVADVRVEAARALADGAGAGCIAYDSYEQMATESTFDAVVICTPPLSHPEICLHFLERKVHVLCEKPLAIDSDS